jgi:hypothetical protein
MTTLLTREQTDALRSIGDGALVLFAMAMVDANFPGRITKPAELLPYLYPTYKDVRKLTTQLRALSASGRLAENGSGYVLLDGGRALLLEMSGTALPTSENDLAQSPALAAGTNAQALILDIAAADGENSARAMRAQKKTLKKEEEDELILKDSDDSSSSDCAQNAQEIAPGVTTRRILLATSKLDGFGEDGVFLHGLDMELVSPRLALGWLAQAYHQRERLGNPAGLVYSRLKSAEQPKPRAKYEHGWENYLPDEFLQDIGWLVIKCDSCDVEFETREALEKHQELLYRCEYDCGAKFHTREELDSHHDTHKPKTPALPMVTRLPAEHRGSQAWGLVLKELLVDLPRASFDTWVRDVTPIGFEGGVMTLAARNAYAMDWLRDRLTDKLEAMLKTFLHEAIRVQFVVGQPTEEDE